MAKLGYFDRYKRLRMNGDFRITPFIDLKKYNTDLYLTFDKSKMRLDNLSYKYYSSPDYAWLIMLANPHLGSLEYLIPDGSKLRIPYPIESALSRYESEISKYLETNK